MFRCDATRRDVLKVLAAGGANLIVVPPALARLLRAPTNKQHGAAFLRLCAALKADPQLRMLDPETQFRRSDYFRPRRTAQMIELGQAYAKAYRAREAEFLASGAYWPFMTQADLDRWIDSLEFDQWVAGG